MPHHSITPLLSGLAAILSTAVPLFAGQEAAITLAPSPAATGWLLDFNAGLALTQGNTDSFGLSLGIDAERRWNAWQFLGKGNYNFAEVQDVTTTNAMRLSRRWLHGPDRRHRRSGLPHHPEHDPQLQTHQHRQGLAAL